MNKYKVRTRFNIVDIAMLCDTLRKTILGTRISNIYDCQPTSMSPRSYIIKLSGTPINSSSSSSSSQSASTTTGKEEDAILNTKHMLLLDPPCRMHVTEYVRPKKDVPSILSLKLRKYIRGKRLEKITQLGIDRVIQLTFGVGESSFNLIIELYAQGNIVLTDSAYTILAVLRHHEYGDGASISVKSTYPLSFVKHLPDDTISTLSLVEKTIEKITTEISLKEANDAKKEAPESEEKGANDADSNNNDDENDKSQQSKKKGQKKGNKGKQQQQQQKKKIDPCYTVLDIIKNIVDFGAHFNNEIVLAAKSIEDSGRNLLKTPLTESEKADLAASLAAHFLKFKRMHAGLDGLTPGYVLLRPSEAKEAGKDEEKDANEGEKKPEEKGGDSDRYYDFAPIEYADCEGIERVEFANFDIALDRFFTQLEVAQMARQQASLESTMGKKLEKLKRDQEERIAGLEDAAERLRKNAMLIEYNIPLVDQAINELRAVIASGLPWAEIELMVKTLKKTDPTSIANIIHHLVLRENRAFLLLSEPSEDDEAEHDATSVPVDLSLSAHGNIEACYTERAGWLSKARKTTDVSDQVIEKAEKKYKNDLKKARANASVSPYSGSGGFLQVRKKFWFEKFNWFVSAEGLVVVSGKDAQQNETLYKRYMRQNDVYVHADIHGAATCIIRSRQDVNGGSIGPVTLEQAGRFAMCRSNAWSSKLVTSAWWVYPSQVSKSAPTGEYLTTGSFMIRGKKNFLPPHQLVMGFGLLFLLDPSSLEAHKDDAMAGNALDSVQTSSSSSSLLSASSSSALIDENTEEQQQDNDNDNEKENDKEKEKEKDDKASVITFVESDMPEPTTKEEDWSSMAESDILSNEPSALSLGDSGKQQPNAEESESKMEDLEEVEEAEVVEGEKSPSVTGTVRHQHPKSKYFDDEDDDETNNDGTENGANDVVEELMKSSTNGGAGKKGGNKAKMSAYARRALKKGIDPTQKSESEEADKKKQQKKKKGGRKGRGDDDDDNDDDSTVSKQEAPAKPKPKLSKAKLKKLKKYADQDEEDRRMRMMLIGHAPKDVKEDNDEENTEDIDLLTGNTTKKAQKKQQQQQKQTKSCFICGSKDHYARDCPKKKLEEQKASIESENAKKAAKKVDPDNVDVDDDDDDDNEGAAGSVGGGGAGGNYSDGIERLTAIPRSDDILLHAIPVCAPYDALQNYKYKVKLTPGHLKRGKAVDSAIQLFLKQQDVTEQEKRLIKAIPHDDLLQCMLSDVTVAGGQASARLKKLKKK